jgi:competence protein ComEA
MTSDNAARGASPRASGPSLGLASGSVLSSDPVRPRGRTAAPRVTLGADSGPSSRALLGAASGPPAWLPATAKFAAAALAVAGLAIVGATAGAHPPASPEVAASAGLPAASVVLLGAASGPPAGNAPSPPPADPPAAATGDAGAEPAAGVLPDGRIILNVASEDELTKLPGIGPSRARAIVALRQRLAKFRAVEDLLRVKGIGRKTLRRIKPNVVLDRPTAGSGSDRGPPG